MDPAVPTPHAWPASKGSPAGLQLPAGRCASLLGRRGLLRQKHIAGPCRPTAAAPPQRTFFCGHGHHSLRAVSLPRGLPLARAFILPGGPPCPRSLPPSLPCHAALPAAPTHSAAPALSRLASAPAACPPWAPRAAGATPPSTRPPMASAAGARSRVAPSARQTGAAPPTAARCAAWLQQRGAPAVVPGAPGAPQAVGSAACPPCLGQPAGR